MQYIILKNTRCSLRRFFYILITVILIFGNNKKFFQCTAATTQEQIDSAFKLFIAREYTKARDLYLEMEKDVATPQYQIIKTYAAYCLLFDGKNDEALKEFQDIADSYSDIYTSFTVGIVERFKEFKGLPLNIKKQIIYAERIRLGIATEFGKGCRF